MLMPDTAPYLRMAKDSSGVGRMDGNRYARIPCPIRIEAASSENSFEKYRQS